jgi:FixJ family two-component response regulator
MPGMSGLELQSELKARHLEVPIIFMTAHESDEEVRARALRNGAVEYLIKPVSETVLLNAVDSALGSK